MFAWEPTRTDAKSFSLTLAIIQTVERSATVKSSCAALTTKPRLALRVRTTPLIGAGTNQIGIDLFGLLERRNLDGHWLRAASVFREPRATCDS